MISGEHSKGIEPASIFSIVPAYPPRPEGLIDPPTSDNLPSNLYINGAARMSGSGLLHRRKLCRCLPLNSKELWIFSLHARWMGQLCLTLILKLCLIEVIPILAFKSGCFNSYRIGRKPYTSKEIDYIILRALGPPKTSCAFWKQTPLYEHTPTYSKRARLMARCSSTSSNALAA